MDIYVKQSKLSGSVTPPASKSVAHRLLIAAFLSGEKCVVTGRFQGKDIEATISILKALGAKIGVSENGFVLEEVNFAAGKCETRLSLNENKNMCGDSFFDCVHEFIKSGANYESEVLSEHNDSLKLSSRDFPLVELNAKESGSSLRFMLPVVAALGVSARFSGEGRLPSRPVDGLMSTLSAHGISFSGEKLPFEMRGRLVSGDFEIAGNVSSQYITGLLLALPVLNGDSRIIIKGGIVSESYIDITLSVLGKFGIEIEKTEYGYFVRGNQKYHSPGVIAAEGDWSSACFLAVSGILCSEKGIIIDGLSEDSAQGDRVVVELLKKAGAEIYFADGRLILRRSPFKAIRFDCSDCPDIVPVMSVALAFAKGVSEIGGVDRLRDKESDRLSAVMEILDIAGVKCEYESNVLTIYGADEKSALNKTAENLIPNQTKDNCPVNLSKDAVREFYGKNDHRIAMSAIVFALCLNGMSRVVGAECIEKSYPDFIDDMKNLGAAIAV